MAYALVAERVLAYAPAVHFVWIGLTRMVATLFIWIVRDAPVVDYALELAPGIR